MLGGVAPHLIVTIRNNALLLKKRKSLEELEKIYGSPKDHIPLEIKNADPEELERFRYRLVCEKRKKIRLQIFVTSLFFVLFILASIFFIRWIT